MHTKQSAMQSITSQRDCFYDKCKKNNLEVTKQQLDQLEHFAQLILEWNKKINLISRKDEQNIWKSHFLQCSALLFKLSFPRGFRVIDIGTGAGLPGIPLKILQPDLEITLVDATQKKITAVKQIISELSFSGITALSGRVEDLATKKEYQNRYSVAIARAVAPLKQLAAWSRPLLGNIPANAGIEAASDRETIQAPALLAIKGGDLEEEINQASAPGWFESVKLVRLSSNDEEPGNDNDKKVVYVHFKNKQQIY